jgi:hypothetical protein
LPKVAYLADINILYAALSDAPIAHTDGRELWRIADCDVSGNIEWVNASQGVDLRGLPHEIEELVRATAHGLPVLV